MNATSERARTGAGNCVERLAVTPNGREVWVGANDAHEIHVLNGQTGGIEHVMHGFSKACQVGITPDGRTAVISDSGSDTIHLYDVATHRPRAVLVLHAAQDAATVFPAPSSPHHITISRDGGTAFVTLLATSQIAVVDIAAARITGALPLGAKLH